MTISAPAVFAGLAAASTVASIAAARNDRPSLPTAITGPPPRRKLAGVSALPVAAAAVSALCLVAPAPVPILTPVVGLVAWRAPAFLRGRASRRRRGRADAELPQLLDLLAAASSAGLSASLSFRRAVGALQGPLSEELSGVLRAVELGGRWRDELRSAADRLDLPDLRRTVAALTRTDTLGSSLATSMQELAEGVRMSRRAAVTERARTAPVKMLFPLVFLVLPAFLLLTVVPVLLTTLQSIQ